MTGVELIRQERDRQIYQEGFDSKHDYEHVNNELARAAICYADPYQYFNLEDPTKIIPNEDFWPEEWDKKWFKPTTRVRDLTKAGALIAAEIDRLLRIEINENKKTLIPEIKRLVDNAFGEFGVEGLQRIIEKLIKFTPTWKSPITGTLYQGFVVPEGDKGLMRAVIKQEVIK